MHLIGRQDELERIRSRVEKPDPSLTLVTGPRRSGKTGLLRAALHDTDVLWYQAAPLPDPDHRRILARRLDRFLEARGDEAGPFAPGSRRASTPASGSASWPELFRKLAEHLYATHRPIAVILDDWHRLVEARSRIIRELTEFWLEVRRRGIPLHLILASRPGPATEAFRDPEDPLSQWLDEDLRLRSLPYRDVTGFLGGAGAEGVVEHPDRRSLALYGVFGGWPDVIRHLDPEASLETNLQTAVLGPEAPLLDWGTDVLLDEIHAPGRYASLLRALGGGARSWSEIREAVPDFGSGGQMAPYIQRLEELGIVEIVRSLDASPDSRRRRYRVVDPFVAFWFRFVLPNRTDLELDGGSEVWRERIRPSLEHHLSLVFPRICRQWVERHAAEVLPAGAREVGGLWGRGYDLEVAGTLTNGDVFYGRTLWGGGRASEEVADEIRQQVDRTRYGFGRQNRHRLVFVDRPAGANPGQRVEQDDRVHVLGPGILAG